jgi:mannan endo-1,4-beta-mannosidase
MSRQPANPNASPEARKLLAYLYEISGNFTLTGQHNTPAHLGQYNEQAKEITGRYPALWGQDFGFHADDMDAIGYRQAVMDEAKKQFAAGCVVTLMWHAVRPVEEEPTTFKEGICGKITNHEWADLLTPGTAVYNRWKRQVDVIGEFLGQLRDARIPVLWRPYHEMNGDWFWWCYRPGADGYAALYKQLYHRLVDHHGLDNLLWVYNPNAASGRVLPYSACYPGHDYVDALAIDVYNNDFQQRHHDEIVQLADGRPVALGEVGVAPTPEILREQPQWAWFMVWTNFLTNENKPDDLRKLFHSPRVLTRPVDYGVETGARIERASTEVVVA